jgi:hypothetical protein
MKVHMARIWKETVDHWGRTHMSGIGKPHRSNHDYGKMEVWYVRVCSFTFEFNHPDQVDACLGYYSQKVRPSSRIPANELHLFGGDQSECQRWFERLPMYLLEEPKRLKVVQALTQAKSRWAQETSKVR